MVYGLWVCAASSRRSSITTSKRLQKYDSRDVKTLLFAGIQSSTLTINKKGKHLGLGSGWSKELESKEVGGMSIMHSLMVITQTK